MKLLAYVPRDAPPGPSRTRLGLLTEGGISDLTAASGLHDVGELLATERSVSEADAGEPIDPDTVRIHAPLPRPGKIVCVGLNYHDHCREQGIEPPPYPPLFAKFANAIASPGDPITRPRATEKLDLEC
ncbi:MAG TPA: fumarylacetoacetate hydrolase family protein, partial [Solirubrobacterales bacterium]|nr:fumarylacetoacetate hydrolase family protein [Solirubrobacterales bacterium]